MDRHILFLIAGLAALALMFGCDAPVEDQHDEGAMMTPEAEFWDWFVANEAGLLDMDGARFAEVVWARLQVYHDGIAMEVGPATQRPREFIVSADGLVKHAQAVEDLCDAAPALSNWTITRFRPADPDAAGGNVEFETARVESASMRALLIRSEKAAVDLVLYVDGIGDEAVNQDHLTAAAYIKLDNAIGEYNVMFLVGYIHWRPLSEAHEESFPFAELPVRFNAVVDRETEGE